MKKQTIKATVKKKGRKYYHIVQDGRSEKYPEKLVINEFTNHLSVGDDFEMEVETEIQKKYIGYDITHFPAELRISDKNKINKYIEYIENAALENRLYQKGVNVLHELDYYDYDERIKEIKNLDCKRRCENTRDRIISYLKNDGTFWSNGFDRLHKEYNCFDYDEEILEAKEKYLIKNEYKYIGKHNYYAIGSIFVEEDRAYKSMSYTKEDDGMSIGFITDCWYSYKCKDVTDTSDGKKAIAGETKYKEIAEYIEKSLRPAIKIKEKAEEELIDAIEKFDTLDRTKNTNFPKEIKKIYIDTFDIYGYGNKLLIDNNDKVWYIINNSSDGANWRLNHIDDRCYGYMANLSSVEKYIENYDDALNVVEKNKKKLDKLEKAKI